MNSLLETDDGKWDGTLRAFWRRLLRASAKNMFWDKEEIPEDEMYIFRAHFATALLASPIKDVIADRDEWKAQHENLLSVRQSDLAVVDQLTQDLATSQAQVEILKESNENWMEGFKTKERDLADADKDLLAAQAEIARLRDALQSTFDGIEQFKYKWMLVPSFGHRINKDIRQAINVAHNDIFISFNTVQDALDTASPSTALQEYINMKADAERYRWLRERNDSGDQQWFVYAANSNSLDNDIDNAIGELKSTTKDML